MINVHMKETLVPAEYDENKFGFYIQNGHLIIYHKRENMDDGGPIGTVVAYAPGVWNIVSRD